MRDFGGSAVVLGAIDGAGEADPVGKILLVGRVEVEAEAEADFVVDGFKLLIGRTLVLLLGPEVVATFGLGVVIGDFEVVIDSGAFIFLVVPIVLPGIFVVVGTGVTVLAPLIGGFGFLLGEGVLFLGPTVLVDAPIGESPEDGLLVVLLQPLNRGCWSGLPVGGFLVVLFATFRPSAGVVAS